MNLYRIALAGVNGVHIEDKPFENLNDAEAFALSEAKAFGAYHHNVIDLGEMIKLKIEVTDTYCGEANYSWVNRHEVWVLERMSSRERIRVAKAEAGWTGMRCKTENYGDSWTLYPSKLLQVMFVTVEFE